METENYKDNTAMLAVSRKLGFVFGIREVVCVKRLWEPAMTACRYEIKATTEGILTLWKR